MKETATLNNQLRPQEDAQVPDRAVQEQTQPGRIWIITDMHLGHVNIQKFEPRPEDFEARIRQNLWNMLRPGDTLIDLGDSHMGPAREFKDVMQDLTPPGVFRIAVRGNHDKNSAQKYRDIGILMTEALVIQGIYLSHHGTQTLPDDAAGQLYGHYHSAPGNPGLVHGMRLSIEENNYQPWLLEKLIQQMSREKLLRPLPERADDCWHLDEQTRQRIKERKEAKKARKAAAVGVKTQKTAQKNAESPRLGKDKALLAMARLTEQLKELGIKESELRISQVASDKTTYGDLDIIVSAEAAERERLQERLSRWNAELLHERLVFRWPLEPEEQEAGQSDIKVELMLTPERYLDARAAYHRHGDGGLLLNRLLRAAGMLYGQRGLEARVQGDGLPEEILQLNLQGEEHEQIALQTLGIDPAAWRAPRTGDEIAALIMQSPLFDPRPFADRNKRIRAELAKRPTYRSFTERLEHLNPEAYEPLTPERFEASLREHGHEKLAEHIHAWREKTQRSRELEQQIAGALSEDELLKVHPESHKLQRRALRKAVLAHAKFLEASPEHKLSAAQELVRTLPLDPLSNLSSSVTQHSPASPENTFE